MYTKLQKRAPMKNIIERKLGLTLYSHIYVQKLLVSLLKKHILIISFLNESKSLHFNSISFDFWSNQLLSQCAKSCSTFKFIFKLQHDITKIAPSINQ